MMRRFLFLSLLVASAPPALAEVASDGFKKLNGSQIKSAFAGHTFSDDVHFALTYRASGLIEGTGMGR